MIVSAKDQVPGCMVGGAVGDALGYAVEFSSYSSIVGRYGEKGIALSSKVTVFGTLRPYLRRGMRTYYCSTLEEALRRAKRAGKQPGCHYGGITLPSGRKAFAIYRDGKVVEKYTA